MRFPVRYVLFFIIGASTLSCNNSPKGSHGPIKLGDSSSIVTETDPAKLEDLVTDLQPVIPSNVAVDTPKPDKPATDTAKKAVAAVAESKPAAVPAGPGLKIEFKETVITLPGLDAKQGGRSNNNGAVFTWTSGNINGSVLHATGNVTKVSQRYQSIVVLRGRNGDLPLDELSNTTSWAPVAGGKGAYPTKGLGENELEFEKASAGEIKSAVTKATRSRRLSRKKAEEWMDLLGKNVKSANQKPLVVKLRSVMWKVDGKDEKGKLFSKQIRIDLPM